MSSSDEEVQYMDSNVTTTTTHSADSTLMSTGYTDNLQTRVSPPTRRARSPLKELSQSRQQSDSLSDDLSKMKTENKHLRTQVKNLQTECQTEQDTVMQLRKKLNSVEKERLKSTSKANEEISTLEGQLAKFRAQLEKGEATRQNLEFELAQARRQTDTERRGAQDRETMISDVNDSMKQKISDMNRQTEELQGQLLLYKKTSEDEEARLRFGLEEKEKIIASCHTEQDILEAEKEKLESLVQQHELKIADFEDKVQELESERKSQTEAIRRQLSDLEHTRDREDRLRRDLESSLSRLKQLEDSVEAERAAHLETKFNSEIVQLRVRDLEGAVDVEKVTKTDLAMNVGKLQRQLRDLEKAYEEERKMSKHTRVKLEKTDKEYENVRDQLTIEINDKKNVISNLGKQLEVHQRNFDELKEELSRAKKRQIYLEETYGGSMRELELLIHNFQLGGSKEKRKKEKSNQKPLAPNIVLETLRHTLSEYQRKLDQTADELYKMKTLSESLSKEGATYKDMIWTKDKTIEETQQSLVQTSKELNRVRTEHSDTEAQLATTKVDLQTVNHKYDKHRTMYQEVSEDILKLAKKTKADDEDKTQLLYNMYQRLVSCASGQHVQKASLSWLDLSSLVQDQVTSIISTVQRQDEKIKHMNQALSSKDKGYEDMRQAHDQEGLKLIDMHKEHESRWVKEKQEMEEHYNQIIKEVQDRSKKNQAMADQAWEKMRMSGNVQHGLESECADLRDQVLRHHQQQSSLLTACALLLGAYYPTHARSSTLSIQRNVLDLQVRLYEDFKAQAAILMETLGLEMSEGGQKEPGVRRKSPLLRFRVGVIAVLASNRLSYIGRQSARMFTSHDRLSGNSDIVVCSGASSTSDRIFKGLGHSLTRHGNWRPGENNTLNWLTNPELLNTITSTMSELQDVLVQRDTDSQPDIRVLINAARNSFQKLTDKCGAYFELPIIDSSLGFREKGSLIKYLGQGLYRCLARAPLEGKLHLITSQEVMGNLQHHILSFTSRLHQAEIDRRNLRLDLNQVRQENASLRHVKGQSEKLHIEVQALTTERQRLIEVERFNSVCSELDNALKREQQAQELLNEQSAQLHDLSHKLDVHASQGVNRDHALQDAVQSLSESKFEMRKKEQQVRHLEGELMSLQEEKKSLHDNMYEAESALKGAAREQDSLLQYLHGVEAALGRAKQEMSWTRGQGNRDFSLSKLLTTADILPPTSGKLSPDLLACQNVVSAFIDVYHQAQSRVIALEEEIDSSKRHIATLKRELSAACRREIGDEVIFSDKSYISRGGKPMFEMNNSYRDAYAPLQPDTEATYNATPHSTRSPSSSPYRPGNMRQRNGIR